jgi:hypothetical protein
LLAPYASAISHFSAAKALAVKRTENKTESKILKSFINPPYF